MPPNFRIIKIEMRGIGCDCCEPFLNFSEFTVEGWIEVKDFKI